MTEAIISAVITGLLSLAGVYFANRKTSALIAYRIQKLEEEVGKHNSMVERMYAVESRVTVVENAIEDMRRE